jgi:hypothetical protein
MKNIAFVWAILAVSIGLAQDKPSLVGSWKLDIAQSELGPGPAPKSVAGTIFKESPQMFSYRSHGIDDKGKPFSEAWSGPEDGSMHPVIRNGKPSGQSGFTREPDGTLVWHSEDADGSTGVGRLSISPDGNTSTTEGTSKSKDGKESKEKQVWHRVGGASAKPASLTSNRRAGFIPTIYWRRSGPEQRKFQLFWRFHCPILLTWSLAAGSCKRGVTIWMGCCVLSECAPTTMT